MKKPVTLVLIILLLSLSVFGCSKYTSHYKAVLFVRSNTADSASMSFYTFEGSMVFRLKSQGTEQLKYSAKLESGNATVYYDCSGAKTELFSLSAGETVDSSISLPEKGTVYIIVETSEKCENGIFAFHLV